MCLLYVFLFGLCGVFFLLFRRYSFNESSILAIFKKRNSYITRLQFEMVMKRQIVNERVCCVFVCFCVGGGGGDGSGGIYKRRFDCNSLLFFFSLVWFGSFHLQFFHYIHGLVHFINAVVFCVINNNGTCCCLFVLCILIVIILFWSEKRRCALCTNEQKTNQKKKMNYHQQWQCALVCRVRSLSPHLATNFFLFILCIF